MGVIKRKEDTDLSEQFMEAFGLSDSPIKKSFHKNILKGIKAVSKHKIRLEPNPRPKSPAALHPPKISQTQESPSKQVSPELESETSPESKNPIDEPIAIPEPTQAPVIQGISEEEHLALLEAARAEAKNQGYEEGIEAGKQQGHSQALSENQVKVDTIMNELTTSIDTIIAERNNIFSDNEESILKFALHVAEKIIGKEVTQNHQALMSIITEALQKITDSDRVVIKAHKDDVLTLKDQLPHIETKLPGVKNIIIQEDISLKRGGAIIETELGFIDATLTAKLTIIESTLLHQLRGTEVEERLS